MTTPKTALANRIGWGHHWGGGWGHRGWGYGGWGYPYYDSGFDVGLGLVGLGLGLATLGYPYCSPYGYDYAYGYGYGGYCGPAYPAAYVAW